MFECETNVHTKVKVPKRGDIEPTYHRSDLLTMGERYRIVRAATNDRDRALIALLADSAARISELLQVRKKDIVMNGNGEMSVVIQTKKMRGKNKEPERIIPVMEATSYVRPYIDSTTIGPNDGLFLLKYGAARKIIIEAAKKAGIPEKKHINPHSWRHIKLTEMERQIQGERFVKLAGWVPGSNMAKDYVHVTSEEAADDYRSAMSSGVKEPPKPKVQYCHNCREIVAEGVPHCPRCGALQGEEGIRERLEDDGIRESKIYYREAEKMYRRAIIRAKEGNELIKIILEQIAKHWPDKINLRECFAMTEKLKEFDRLAKDRLEEIDRPMRELMEMKKKAIVQA